MPMGHWPKVSLSVSGSSRESFHGSSFPPLPSIMAKRSSELAGVVSRRSKRPCSSKSDSTLPDNAARVSLAPVHWMPANSPQIKCTASDSASYPHAPHDALQKLPGIRIESAAHHAPMISATNAACLPSSSCSRTASLSHAPPGCRVFKRSAGEQFLIPAARFCATILPTVCRAALPRVRRAAISGSPGDGSTCSMPLSESESASLHVS